ncbi:MAG: hypothetical protein JWR51_788 [Devosia sp.]|uniref:hypothetical protein n=1 Tax=Devosia sp. TaxID=1871048 RepID=UPI00262CD000|nr:hypothetical protein [Devosia sp.]MDB5527685.1 hypothetical protein [Devosia sp.]
MQINRRITNGLAWAGLFVVVAVPVADAVSRQLMGDEPQFAVATVAELPRAEAPVPAPLSQRPHAPVIETAAIAPAQPPVVKQVVPAAAKPVAAANPVVDSFLSSGKKLPSYITGGDDEPAQAVVAPAPAKPVAPAVTKPIVAPVETAVVAPAKPVVAPEAPVAIDPVEVAALAPANIAPMPMPLSMRPTPVTRPLATMPRNDDIVLPPEVLANNNAQPAVVDDLRDWESGPLSEFLARRRAQQQSSSATVTSERAFPDGYYDDSAAPRPRRDVYLGPVQDDAVFFPFIN